MANDLNSCSFIGRLGNDPDTKYTAAGSAVCNISLACGWKSKDKEGVEWVRVAAFGKLAEIMQQYLRKGSQVFIEGRLRTDKYEKDGQTHYSTSIIANNMQMLGSKGDSQDAAQRPQTSQSPPQESAPVDTGFDDIPF